jgi:hypothetical protein
MATVKGTARAVFEALKRVGHLLVEPLRVDDALKSIRIRIRG